MMDVQRGQVWVSRLTGNRFRVVEVGDDRVKVEALDGGRFDGGRFDGCDPNYCFARSVFGHTLRMLSYRDRIVRAAAVCTDPATLRWAVRGLAESKEDLDLIQALNG
jgi:hypothetical protein